MNLIRNILGLIITITMLPICIEAFIFTSNIGFDYNQINDEIALCELREQLLISYDMEVNSNELRFIYKNKNYTLSMVNEKLLLQPGTQIYLNDIDDINFEVMNGCIYINYQRDNKEYEKILCKQEGLYINDFSGCDVLATECDSSEE